MPKPDCPKPDDGLYPDDGLSVALDPKAEPPLANAPPLLPPLNAPPLNAPPPALNAPLPKPLEEPKADGPLFENAPNPEAGLTGPAPNAPNVELEVAPPPKGDVEGCCCVVAPKEPNIELLAVFGFDESPPPPNDKPPKPESVSDAILSSEDDVMSTEMVGVLMAGAVGGEVVDCCCAGGWPKPKDVLPNADVAPENALNPKAPVDGPVAFCGEVDAKGLVDAACEVPKTLCCGVVCTGAAVGVVAAADSATIPG